MRIKLLLITSVITLMITSVDVFGVVLPRGSLSKTSTIKNLIGNIQGQIDWNTKLVAKAHAFQVSQASYFDDLSDMAEVTQTLEDRKADIVRDTQKIELIRELCRIRENDSEGSEQLTRNYILNQVRLALIYKKSNLRNPDGFDLSGEASLNLNVKQRMEAQLEVMDVLDSERTAAYSRYSDPEALDSKLKEIDAGFDAIYRKGKFLGQVSHSISVAVNEAEMKRIELNEKFRLMLLQSQEGSRPYTDVRVSGGRKSTKYHSHRVGSTTSDGEAGSHESLTDVAGAE